MSANSGKQVNKISLALALISSLNAGVAGAVQILHQGSSTDAATATVSRNEPNMIRVEGRKIRRIHGAEGLFTVTPEKDTGVAWVKPTSDAPMMSIFITDDAGQHWKVLLKVEDIPAETIIIRGGRRMDKPDAIARNEPRNDALLRIIMSLYDREGDSKNEIIPLWEGTRFVLVRTLDAGDLRGEAYLLTNTSDREIVMDEREFYRDGVQAVSVEQPVLGPNETTPVYVISEGQ